MTIGVSAVIVETLVVVGASVVVCESFGVQATVLPHGKALLNQYIPKAQFRNIGKYPIFTHSLYFVQSGRYSNFPVVVQVGPQAEPPKWKVTIY